MVPGSARTETLLLSKHRVRDSSSLKQFTILRDKADENQEPETTWMTSLWITFAFSQVVNC